MSGSSPPSRATTVARLAGRIASTGAYRLVELAPGRRRTRAVPAAPTDLTVEWLSTALCAGVPRAAVTRVTHSGSTSQTTARATLAIEYNDQGVAAGLPGTVFAKFTTTFQQRLFMGLIRCIDGEPLFYRDIRNELNIASPRGYFGAVDPRSWRSVVLIEDVAATQGAEFLHATSDVSRSDIETLVIGMGAIHGATWGSPDLDRHRWLKRPIDHLHNTSAFLNMQRRVQVGVARAESVIPPAVGARLGNLWQNLLFSMSANSRGPLTLLHGDPHIGNTYRAGDGTLNLLDWQVCMKGGWAFDFAYAVGSALEVEDRRAWEMDLLAMYLDAVHAAGGSPPSMSQAIEEYRHSLMYPFHTWTTVIGRSALQPQMQEDDVSLLIIGRLAQAIDDHEAFAPRR